MGAGRATVAADGGAGLEVEYDEVDDEDLDEAKQMDPMLQRTVDAYNEGYSNGGVDENSAEGKRRKREIEEQAMFIEL